MAARVVSGVDVFSARSPRHETAVLYRKLETSKRCSDARYIPAQVYSCVF